MLVVNWTARDAETFLYAVCAHVWYTHWELSFAVGDFHLINCSVGFAKHSDMLGLGAHTMHLGEGFFILVVHKDAF